MMSCTRRYLNLGSIALVLVLFVPNAQAQGPKEQLQGTIDSVMKVLLTIQSRNDIERNREPLRKLLVARFDYAAMARQ